MRRGRLEEAKVPGEENGPRGEESRSEFTPQSSEAMTASTSSKILQHKDLVRRQNLTMNSIPFILSNAKVLEAQLISAFWEYYVPSESSAQAGSQCAWLHESICLSNYPPALRLSLIALAMTRLGWLHEDNVLVRGGMTVYGFALTELQKSLSHQPLLFQDETLATCNVLALYEVGKSSTSILRIFNHIRAAC